MTLSSATSKFKAVCAAAFVSFAVAAPVAAQESVETLNDGQTIDAFGDWLMECNQPPTPEGATEAPPELCEIRSSVTTTREDGEQRLLLMMGMGPVDKGGNFWVVFQTPQSVLLTSGVKIKIDPTAEGGEAAAPLIEAKFLYCDASRCLSRSNLTAAQVKTMIEADEVQVRYEGATGQKIYLPLSLEGFADATTAVQM